METKIASYQEQAVRLQLIEITKTINGIYPIKIKEICGGWLIKWSNGKNEPTTYENAKMNIEIYKMKLNYDTYEYTKAIKLNRKYYQIRKNRKILCNLKYETAARQEFNKIIQQELLQTKMDL